MELKHVVIGVLVFLIIRYPLFHYLLRKYDWNLWYRRVYLKSLHWQFLRWRKRMWTLLTKGVVNCEKCGNKTSLQYHHITYNRIGHERLSDLQIICSRCHRKGSGRI